MSKKKNSLHRVVAFLLAVLLCLNGLPANGMTVHAEGETTTTSGNWTDEDNYSQSLSGDPNLTAEAGTAENPYLIKSAADLAWLAVKCDTEDNSKTNTEGKYFKLAPSEGTIIDLSAHYWIPIARFFGHLDGNGVSITGLKIGSDGAPYTGAANVGLFGRIDSGSVVENLSVDVAIYTSNTSAHYVAGIAGISNGGTIDSCMVTGTITATGSNTRLCVGGLVGRAQSNMAIVNCINKASVNATGSGISTFAAGIAGQENGSGSGSGSVKVLNSCNFGNIAATAGTNTAYAGGIVTFTSGQDYAKYLLNCYNAGNVTSSGDTAKAGSIVGQMTANTFTDYLYWQNETANNWYGSNASGGSVDSANIAAKSAADITTLAETLNSNITAIKSNTTLSSLDLKTWTAGSDGYPLPGAAQSGGGEEINATYWTDEGAYSASLSGKGTDTEPFLIQSAADLALLAVSYNTTAATNGKYFKISATEIDLSQYEWVPITNFQGTLDGNGAKISGLRIGSETKAHDATAFVGMFGRLDSGAVVKNLTVAVEIHTNTNGETLGDNHHMVGGIAGRNVGGTIDGCTVTGKIIAGYSGAKNLRVGGIAGETQYSAVISNSINNVAVSATGTTGSTFAGGVAGYMADNDRTTFIVNCSNLGAVTGGSSSTGAVYTGGIVGAAVNTGTTKDDTKMYLLNCYNAGLVTVSGTSTKVGSIAGQAQYCNLGYLYWEKQTASQAFNYKGSCTEGTDAATAGMEADALKAYQETLTQNAAVLAATYTNLSLQSWTAGTEGGYPLLSGTAVTPGDNGGEDDTGGEGGTGTEGGTTTGTLWTDHAATALNGEGTEASPYIIKTAADLALLAKENATYSNAYIKLDPDDKIIDLSEYEWVMINSFNGHLDGNGVSITGLRMGYDKDGTEKPVDAVNVGMFNSVNAGAVIENMSVDVNISTNYTQADGTHVVAGIARANMGEINACTVTGSIKVNATSCTRVIAGGIAGRHQNAAKISNCINYADIVVNNGGSTQTYVGGIAGSGKSTLSGETEQTAYIINVVNFGDVTLTNGGANHIFVGGIVADLFRESGTGNNPELQIAYNVGQITCNDTATETYVGGVAGRLLNAKATSIYMLENTHVNRVGNLNVGNVKTAEVLKAAEFFNELNVAASKLNEGSTEYDYNANKWIADTRQDTAGYAVPGTEKATDKTLTVTVNSALMGSVKVEVMPEDGTSFTEVAVSSLVADKSTVRLTPQPVKDVKVSKILVDGQEVTLTDGSYSFVLTKSIEAEVTFEVANKVTAAPIYVNPNAAANGDGTSPEKAFQTLKDAQTKLRSILDESPTAEVTIYLMGGTYVLDETWVLGEEDTSLGRVTIKNYENETPVITSGHQIPAGCFKKVDGKEYWAYQLTKTEGESYPAFRDLLVNGELAVLARSKDYTYVKSFKDSVASGSALTSCSNGVYVSQEVMAGITNENLAKVELGMLIEWKSQIFHVGNIVGEDTESGEIEIALVEDEWQKWYNMDMTKRVLTGRNYWLQNHISFLDEPGEFYYDQQAGVVYYYPYADEDMEISTVEYATLDELIHIENAANITLDGITFTGTTANEITEKGLAAQLGLSHQMDSIGPWDPTKTIPYAAVRGDIVEGIRIENCTFKELGGSAIVFHAGVKDMKITGNSIKDLAMGGILVGQNERSFGSGSSIDVEISNNYITNIGLMVYGAPAIRTSRAKNLKIQYNTIVHVPYSGIMTGYGFNVYATEAGNTNLVNADISYNYVEDFVFKLNDGAAIYTCMANAFTEQTNYFNYIHHNYVRAGANNNTYTGIYHDGSASNWRTYENVIDDLVSRKGPMFFQDDVEDQYTHNILAENNITTVSKISTTAKADRNIQLKNNVMLADRSELRADTAAAAIMSNAGLQAAYKNIATPMDAELRIADDTMRYVVDSSAETNTQARLELTNNSAATRSFTVSLTEELPPYVSCEFKNNGVTLAPGETAVVIAEFIITDEKLFADTDEYIGGFLVTDGAGRKTQYPRAFTVSCTTGQARVAYATPTLDGVMDDAYLNSTSIPVGYIFNMVSYDVNNESTKHPLTEAVSDVTGFARLLWDDEYLYCYVLVEEKQSTVASRGMDYINDKKVNNPVHLWSTDGVELYMNTSYSATQMTKFAVDAFGIMRYGDGTTTLDVHKTLPYATAFTYNGEIVEGLEIKNPVKGQNASTAEKPVNGYALELALPLTTCTDLEEAGKPQAGDMIKFYMQNNDYEYDANQGTCTVVSLKNAVKDYLLVKETEITPTPTPTVAPTQAPTAAPTVAPTAEPTTAPTSAPTAEPTQAPADDTSNDTGNEDAGNAEADNSQNVTADTTSAAVTPSTGDSSNVGLWILLVVLSVGAGVIAFILQKRKITK